MATAPSRLQLDVVRVGRTTTVFVHGEVDLAAAPELGRALARNAAASAELVVDLRQATFLDCASIGVLLNARRAQQVLGGSLRCTGAHGLVRRVFELTGAATVLD